MSEVLYISTTRRGVPQPLGQSSAIERVRACAEAAESHAVAAETLQRVLRECPVEVTRSDCEEMARAFSFAANSAPEGVTAAYARRTAEIIRAAGQNGGQNGGVWVRGLE